MNSGRLLPSCRGTRTDVALLGRGIGGGARAGDAVWVYIYAKYMRDSLHGHTVKSTTANATRSSEHIMT